MLRGGLWEDRLENLCVCADDQPLLPVVRDPGPELSSRNKMAAGDLYAAVQPSAQS